MRRYHLVKLPFRAFTTGIRKDDFIRILLILHFAPDLSGQALK